MLMHNNEVRQSPPTRSTAFSMLPGDFVPIFSVTAMFMLGSEQNFVQTSSVVSGSDADTQFPKMNSLGLRTGNIGVSVCVFVSVCLSVFEISRKRYILAT